ncbi:MAG: hypothetical protein A3I05_06820 [Deltaproteobacteria bacterium RIFCSPLOWO2_02_FULL_44_10]|nr:MAG: hypothetical protein A3C46_07010 [Deltaproteobacteria bacterium RIFCSPHIGHO2_02_FULL_44_16]OGQ46735.1 MAG: hypothetical protein A3I05_06820 [Deltaproteobacteria bacterium RIFCSPLOWO2_02_FULL_44_10]
MQVEIYGLTDVGKRREKNEDSFLINPALKLCMVADGMGGHLGGERASKIAVHTVEEVLVELEKDPETTLEEGADIVPSDYKSYLQYAISIASNHIYEESTKELKLKGMGTTSVVLLFRDNAAYVANVGDSRAYLVSDGKIAQITKDHSLVGEQLRAGFLTEDDAKQHRLKNVITRSVGFQETVVADIEVRDVQVGDIFLLCSDGLSNLIESHEIRDVVANNALEDACKRLIDLANERGGDDNITVVLASILSLDDDLQDDLADESTLDIS